MVRLRPILQAKEEAAAAERAERERVADEARQEREAAAAKQKQEQEELAAKVCSLKTRVPVCRLPGSVHGVSVQLIGGGQ